MNPLTRRSAMKVAGTVGAVAACACGLSACGSGGGNGDGGGASAAEAFAAVPPTTVPVADVPVGSGIVIDEAYVVAQPEEGQFYAYSSVCTHQGCQVRQVTAEDINCPCHSSKFSVTDGAPLNGPATIALPKADVQVDGGTLTVSPAAEA